MMDARSRFQTLEPSAFIVSCSNDAAGGVGVRLELARTADITSTRNEIWLVFFDAKDNRGIEGWDWIVGSRYMAERLTINPYALILIDVIGDADQQIYLERKSNLELSMRLFRISAELGYGEQFIPVPKHAVIDDCISFARRGIPSVDLLISTIRAGTPLLTPSTK